jgi:hypothetical protein
MLKWQKSKSFPVFAAPFLLMPTFPFEAFFKKGKDGGVRKTYLFRL